ncbi:L,D-transpeptidase [Kiritimatiellaeota bacterium B1221]|nr:L,D-transpeptidase [Kiritimatiellaeota bacterium B1221]
MQPLIHVGTLKKLNQAFPGESEIWAVDLQTQSCTRLKKGRSISATPISSSRFGVSDTPGSLKTPLGAHRVCEIIGTGAPLGQPFKSRLPVASPLQSFTGGTGDAILTRILWLKGLVPELNRHSKSRYIYIHGTHQEEKLGQPASQGCIRMGNQVLADWTDSLNGSLPLVWIGTIDSHHA